MIFIGFRVKQNFHRNALHHLHVISGSILRRQQAEPCPAGSGDAVDFSVIFPAIRVNFERDRCPTFISRSWVSLKFAVIQMSSRLMTFINS